VEFTKIKSNHLVLGLVALWLLAATPSQLAAQAAGSIQFTARVSATNGRPEPVRQLTFSLLRKSLEDIRLEALQQEPAPEMDHFIEDLKVSPQLRGWMKKHQSVQLAGPDFSKGLSADEIMDVPEFFSSYMAHNAGLEGTGFPEPKFKEKDRVKNPEKFEAEKKAYREEIRKFIKTEPDSVQGLEAGLEQINPSIKWEGMVAEHQRRLEKQTLELAQAQYVATETDTDLEGRGFFANVPPGNYWIDILGMQAISGDVRLRWDFPVEVRPAQATQVALNNLNASKPRNRTSASNR
jgi:hypothetical protein